MSNGTDSPNATKLSDAWALYKNLSQRSEDYLKLLEPSVDVFLAKAAAYDKLRDKLTPAVEGQANPTLQDAIDLVDVMTSTYDGMTQVIENFKTLDQQAVSKSASVDTKATATRAEQQQQQDDNFLINVSNILYGMQNPVSALAAGVSPFV